MIEQFDTKRIVWQDARGRSREATILIQNENGPCPLVALVNTLILREEYQDEDKFKGKAKGERPISLASYTHGKEKISVDSILGHLGNILVQQISEKASRAGTSRTNGSPSGYSELLDGDTEKALGLLPRLITGLNINVQFDGTFDNGQEMALFRIYNVDIVHGWVCDPQNPESELIHQIGSYDESQSILLKDSELDTIKELSADAQHIHAQAGAVRFFLEENPTQLSVYGLERLRRILAVGLPVVLFRNDHFSTLYRTETGLYTLVTDFGYKNESKVVWQSLSSINGRDDQFFDGLFQTPTIGENNDDRTVTSHNPHDPDFALAKELQETADSEYAKELSQQYQQRPVQERRHQQPPKRDDKKKKCIIM